MTISTFHVESAILSWLWDRGQKESTLLVSDGVPLISIPYESMTDDEKFLQEAAKFTEMQVSSPLETCYHKVIMKIRSSCNEMSEEDLAKLSVNLLNCQSLVEGRKIYPCTQDMSLKQCTTEMDADMWNAYHLMSNRARAVCYSARNLQFRALTELTVNKLVQTTHSQIKVLENLQENQEKLEKETVDALSLIEKGNKKLLEQHNLVASNLRELTMEKALIRLGHSKLITMTEDIKEKLVKANDEMLRQESDRKINHQEVMNDLLAIQELWEKLENSTNNILKQNQEAANQYLRTLEQLEQINKTVNFVWNLHKHVDEKLGWITDYISSTGLQMQKVYRTCLHVIYILTAMIVAGFLQAPFLTRVTILGIIPLNLTAYLKHGMEASLDFFSITALIILITIMHYVMSIIQYLCGPKKTKSKNLEQNETSGKESTNLKNQNKEKEISQDCSKNVDSTTKGPLFSEIYNTVSLKFYLLFNRIHYIIDVITKKIVNVFHVQRNQSILQEELTCSYIQKKPYNYVSFDSANMSDDLSESDLSQKHYSIREDLWTMRQRHNISRSKTPVDSSGYLNRCCELTRSGKPCRGKVMKNLNYCRIHLAASPAVKI